MTGPLVQVWWSRSINDGREQAHQLLVRAAAHALGRPTETITVGREPSGRPCLVGDASRLHVGISHCRAGAVAVVTSTLAPVGVDVEVIRPLEWLPIATRFMAADEVEWLTDQPAASRVTAFLTLWTQKEAVGKAYGVGLRGGGLRRSTSRGGAGAGAVPVGGTWTLRPTPDDESMVAAVAQPAPGVVLAVACATGHADGSAATVHQIGPR